MYLFFRPTRGFQGKAQGVGFFSVFLTEASRCQASLNKKPHPLEIFPRISPPLFYAKQKKMMHVLIFHDQMGVGEGGVNTYYFLVFHISSISLSFTSKNLKKDFVFQRILLQYMGLGQWQSGSLLLKIVISFLGVFSSFYRFFVSYCFFSCFFLVFFFLLFCLFFNCFLKHHWCLLWIS